MKKILSIISSCFITTAICCGDGVHVVSRLAQKVNNEKRLLKQKGISDESVALFKENMGKILKHVLSSFEKGSIDKRSKLRLVSNIQSDIDLIERILRYEVFPTEEDAKELRAWANSSTFWAEVIIPEMNKQIEQRFKFNKSF